MCLTVRIALHPGSSPAEEEPGYKGTSLIPRLSPRSDEKSWCLFQMCSTNRYRDDVPWRLGWWYGWSSFWLLSLYLLTLILSSPLSLFLPSLILPSLILPSLFAYSTKKYSYSWWSTGPVTTSHSSSFPLFPPTHQTSRRQEHLCRVSWWVWRRHYRSHDTWDHLGHVPGGHFVSGNPASISDTYPLSQLQLWTHPNRSECKYTSSNSLLSDHKHLIS